MRDKPRFTERAFPLKQASTYSVRKRQVRLYKVGLFQYDTEKPHVEKI
jgi:hypothetical protein